jgi:hypothetical protein
VERAREETRMKKRKPVPRPNAALRRAMREAREAGMIEVPVSCVIHTVARIPGDVPFFTFKRICESLGFVLQVRDAKKNELKR